MISTTADNEKATYGPFPDPSTLADLANQQFAGDVQKYGYGYAVIKNWGVAGDTVVEAERRHYSASSTESYQDARYRFYSGQSPSLDFVSDSVYDKVQGAP